MSNNYNIGLTGTWTDGGGSASLSESDLDALHNAVTNTTIDVDVGAVEIAPIIGDAPAIYGIADNNLVPKNKTFILGPATDYISSSDGILKKVTLSLFCNFVGADMYASVDTDGIYREINVKIKYFTIDGSTIHYIAEDDLGHVKVYQGQTKLQDFNINRAIDPDVLIGLYITRVGDIDSSTVQHMSVCCPDNTDLGIYISMDVQSDTESSIWSGDYGDANTKVGMRLTGIEHGQLITHIEFDNFTYLSDIRVYCERLNDLSDLSVYLSDDDSSWLEFSTYNESLVDATANIYRYDFELAQGAKYVKIEISNGDVTRNISPAEIEILSDEDYILFKPSDFNVLAGNAVVARSNSVNVNNYIWIERTIPVSTNGYIYGIGMYAHVHESAIFEVFVLRDEGDYLNIIGRSMTESIEPHVGYYDYSIKLATPLRVMAGDYIAIRGINDVDIAMDRVATATSPVAADDNVGSGYMSDIILENELVDTEDWTVECIVGGGANVAKFRVTGSISGVQTAEVTSNIEYTNDNGAITFIIYYDAPNEWVVGDTFTFSTREYGTVQRILSSLVDSDATRIYDADCITLRYNMAFAVDQNIYTTVNYLYESYVGITNEAEPVRVYNNTANVADIYCTIIKDDNTDADDSIEISTDGSTWYGVGTTLTLSNVAAGDYAYLYTRFHATDISAGDKTAKILCWAVVAS